MSNATQGAVVGEDAQFSGRFGGQDLTVLGRLEGDVELKGRLLVGKQGRVKAKVKAAATEIQGEFEGEVRTDALILTETARARGTFVAKRMSVREGAVLEGSVNPSGGGGGATAASAAPAAPPAPAPDTTAGGGGGAAAPQANPGEGGKAS
jgi:cytoskeletal protein CcmA (bactofilin family)